MNDSRMYEIIISRHFERQARPLMRKNSALKNQLKAVLSQFHKLNSVSIGKSVYKLRMQGLNKGKSGGYRLYVYVIEISTLLSPIAIYAKSEKENLSFKEVVFHLEKVKEQLSREL